MAKKKYENTEHDKQKMIERISLEFEEGRLSKMEFDMWMAVYRRQKADKESKIRTTGKQKRR